MFHFQSLAEIPHTPAWLTIGVFDGIHLGHRSILDQLVAGAKTDSVASAVITFYPHPAVVLGKIPNPSYITSPAEKVDLLHKMGVEMVVTLPFDLALAELTAEQFMGELAARIQIRRLLVGQDFALGRGREGTLSRLQQIGEQLGYSLTVLDPVLLDGERISSSLIRANLLEGAVSQAARLLGRFYRISGKVIRGDGRGKQLGFPTANLEFWSEKLLPASGVYATWAWVEGQRHPSVTNLGVRPTFDQGNIQPHLETHLLNYNRNLYGKTIELDMVARLRPEMRFPTVDALVAQVNQDIKTAQEILDDTP
ncbi:MAG: bifunctional riboflavin kinase/FAD synthetase [Chloroflexota bacterium]|jgi:riboflavin kinase/FMN adenylyltransferase